VIERSMVDGKERPEAAAAVTAENASVGAVQTSSAMLQLSLHHVGIAVRDMGDALKVYEGVLGYRRTNPAVHDAIQDVYVCFLAPAVTGGCLLELVAPASDQSPIQRTLANGEGVYHLCYEVADLGRALAALRASGFLIIGRPVPAVAFGGRPIAWLYSPSRQLIELVEAPTEHRS